MLVLIYFGVVSVCAELYRIVPNLLPLTLPLQLLGALHGTQPTNTVFDRPLVAIGSVGVIVRLSAQVLPSFRLESVLT